MKYLLTCYFFFFVCPFCVSVFFFHEYKTKPTSPDADIEEKLFVNLIITNVLRMATIMQGIMFLHELLDIYYNVFQYLGIYNFLHLTEFVMFLYMRDRHTSLDQVSRSQSLITGYFEIIQCVGITIRIVELLSIFSGVRTAKEMFKQVLVDIVAIMLVWLIFIIFFMMVQIIMNVEMCSTADCSDGSHDDYPNVYRFVRVFLQTFRNSIGDIGAPGYDSWGDYSKN